VAQIAASIREFGWTNPVLIDGADGIIAGHGRLLAARKLGLTEVPCIVLDHLSETQKRALIIADNKLALNAGWDSEMLGLELQELAAEDFDMGLVGFTDDELAALLAEKTEGLTDPDETPEPPADPVSVLGDVWVLGKHRIVCGDSTDADTVAKCLNGVTPHLMVTDPPYGVEYDASWRQDRGVNKAGPGAATGKVLNDDRADWSEAWALFPGDVAYVWHAGLHAASVAQSLASCDLIVRTQIIWNKSSMLLGRGDYHWKHEPCWYAVRKGRVGHYVGGRKQTTVWDIEKPRKSETGHSTQKPVECMKRPIENNSSAGQAVYEPFSGSGTTIIAGEMTGRSIHAIELSPAYVDVAVIRWQEFTGEKAVHEDGRVFDDMRTKTDAKEAA
jgi:DNA modification methylase